MQKKKKNSCSFLPPTQRSKLPLWVWRGWEITTYIITICRILVRIIRKHLCFSASWSKAKYSQLRHFKRVQMLLIKNKHKDFPQDYSYNCHFLLRKKFLSYWSIKCFWGLLDHHNFWHLIVLPSPEQFWLWAEMSELPAVLLMQREQDDCRFIWDLNMETISRKGLDDGIDAQADHDICKVLVLSSSWQLWVFHEWKGVTQT